MSPQTPRSSPPLREELIAQMPASMRKHYADEELANISNDELEFMIAIDAYKKSSGHMYPTWNEMLSVIQSIGLSRPDPSPADQFNRSVMTDHVDSLYKDAIIDLPYHHPQESQNDLVESEQTSSRPVPTATPTSGDRSTLLDALLATVPESGNVAESAQNLAGLNHEFRQHLAARLAPSLNAHIQAMPHEDLEGKKAVCDFVASMLEPLALAVQCPNTKLPAKLKATSGNRPGLGSFYFEVHMDGKRKTPKWSDTLPFLQLMDSIPPQEHISTSNPGSPPRARS